MSKNGFTATLAFVLGLAWAVPASATHISSFTIDPATGGVVVGDKIWRQVTETTGFSYNDLVANNICNAATGACAGSLDDTLGLDRDGVGGDDDDVSFDGWIWATDLEAGALFDAFYIESGDTNGTPGCGSMGRNFADVCQGTPLASVELFLSLFDPTITRPRSGQLLVIGGSRTVAPTGRAITPFVEDVDDGLNVRQSTYINDPRVSTTVVEADRGQGQWLYRSSFHPTAVSAPPTVLLLALVAAIGLFQRMSARVTSQR